MKLGWLADIHLDFLDDAARRNFILQLAKHEVDAWLLCGDIGQAGSVNRYLRELADGISAPLYFVLGNHDFYGGSLERVRPHVRSLALELEGLVWLTGIPAVPAAPGVAITGDDGWSDARLGDPAGSDVELNDFYLIEELTVLGRAERIRTLNRLGDEAAARLAPKLEQAAGMARTVLVVTHPPPFAGASWHQGQMSGSAWLPWFACDAAGRVILECARRHPETSFEVFCGHTHGGGRYSPCQNVDVLTAAAEYGKPEVQGILVF
jgi:Icc protein